MQSDRIAQAISTLIVAPSDDILREISHFLLEAQQCELNALIATWFQSLVTLERWAWEILSRDSRVWHDDEQQYFELFSNLASLNKRIILNYSDYKIKQSLLAPGDVDVIDGIFQQIQRRHDENDRLLSMINRWFDGLSLLIREHIEFSSISVIIYINERIASEILKSEQFQIYLDQLHDTSPLFSVQQLFYTRTCPFLLGEYLYSKPQVFIWTGLEIIEYLAQHYTTLLHTHRQTMSSWSQELLACITHLIGLMTACHCWIGSDRNVLKMFVMPDGTVHDYVTSLIDILSYQPFHEQVTQQWSNDQSMLIDNILGLLKYFTHFHEMISLFRTEKRLVEIFSSLNRRNNDRICLVTYELQADILSEAQIKRLDNTDNTIKIFFYYLQQARQNPFRQHQRMSFEELLTDLLNLSKKDEIKTVIAHSNQLKFLLEFSDDYPIIYDILWSLSFDIHIQKQLRFDRTFIASLDSIHPDKYMQKIMDGIQWNLNSADRSSQTTTVDKGEKYDIVLSCAREDKNICTRLYNELIRNDLHVWITDFAGINENVMNAMANTIARTSTIIICMSEHYKRNNYCRAEAQFAFNKKVKIVPVTVEHSYKPDGWLSFLIGGLSSMDLTEENFTQAVPLLVSEIRTPRIAVLDSLVARQQPQNIASVSLPPLRSINIRQWTPKDVQQWLTENNLVQMADLLSDHNGLDLIELSQVITSNSPQDNLQLFEQDSKKSTGNSVSLIEIDRLNHLIEEQMKTPTKARKSVSKPCCRMI